MMARVLTLLLVVCLGYIASAARPLMFITMDNKGQYLNVSTWTTDGGTKPFGSLSPPKGAFAKQRSDCNLRLNVLQSDRAFEFFYPICVTGAGGQSNAQTCSLYHITADLEHSKLSMQQVAGSSPCGTSFAFSTGYVSVVYQLLVVNLSPFDLNNLDCALYHS